MILFRLYVFKSSRLLVPLSRFWSQFAGSGFDPQPVLEAGFQRKDLFGEKCDSQVSQSADANCDGILINGEFWMVKGKH